MSVSTKPAREAPQIPTEPRVSIVVSTYNRAGHLERLIGALEVQTLPLEQFEVIVVDNGSTDTTQDMLARQSSSSPLNLTVIRSERNLGPAGGRNLGWRAAAASVVAFTDDDCLPQPNWLSAGLEALDGRARVVVGRTCPNPSQLARAARPFSSSVDVNCVRFFETCNVFYRLEDLVKAGGFDERFHQPSGEDTDLGLKVCSFGTEAIFVPSALVYHEVWAGGLLASLRQTLRWVDIPLVLGKHPNARSQLLFAGLFWKRSHPSVLALAAGLIAGHRFKPALLLAVPWLYLRLWKDPICPGPRRRVVALPGALMVDFCEVAVMVAGSVRHRVVVL